MEIFSALLALCTGNSPVPVSSPYKGQWRGALVCSFICVWINDWVNNREAGDLRRHRGHYDVNVMMPHNVTKEKSTLIQASAWCRQAASHCLSQCLLTRPQWVTEMRECEVLGNYNYAKIIFPKWLNGDFYFMLHYGICLSIPDNTMRLWKLDFGKVCGLSSIFCWIDSTNQSGYIS